MADDNQQKQKGGGGAKAPDGFVYGYSMSADTLTDGTFKPAEKVLNIAAEAAGGIALVFLIPIVKTGLSRVVNKVFGTELGTGKAQDNKAQEGIDVNKLWQGIKSADDQTKRKLANFVKQNSHHLALEVSDKENNG